MSPDTPVVGLFRERGIRMEAGANAPVLLEDPDIVWLVAKGHVNVFAVTVLEDRPQGARDYLFTVEAGGLLPGVEPAWADAVGLLAVGTVGAEILRLQIAELRSATGELRAELKARTDQYIRTFSSAVSDRGQPRVDILLAPGAHKELEPGLSVSARRRVAWTHIERGELLFAALPSLRVRPEDGPFPVAPGAWLISASQTVLRVEFEDELITDGTPWHGLRSFQRIALEWAREVIEADRARERQRLRERLASDEAVGQAALEALAKVIEPQAAEPLVPTPGALLSACQLIGRELGVEFRSVASWNRARGTASDELAAITRASGVPYRRVVLPPDWWKRDNGPLLGLVRTANVGAGEADRERPPGHLDPVALLPRGPSAYDALAPGSGMSRRVDDVVGQALEPLAYQFYRPLPHRALSARDLWDFVTFGVWRDVRTILLMAVAGAALGLLLPILTGTVYDAVIPSADGYQLANVFVALVVATLASTCFQLTRSFAVIRFHTKVEAGLQMAVLDRLLRLPLPFFRQYTAGDMGLRARGISAIGHSLGGATITSLFGSLVSGAAYALLFIYSVPLALLATLILVINVLFVSATAYFALRHARQLEAVQGRLSGLILELLSGISKLRVAAAEARSFARWSREFRREQELGYRLGHFQNNVDAFNAVLSIASTLALYWAYVEFAGAGGGLTTGEFLAFNAAFGMLIAAAMELTGTAIGLIGLIPTWERAKPILDAVPEVSVDKPDPGELTGRIEVSHLSFRYSEDGPLVLNDVSLDVAPGEFIALVGPSGAGKSTLLRVLLGFDMPDTSAVYYDRHDLAQIDVGAVRRQIGVVLQSSRLTAGDIFSNIAGTGSYTLLEVQEAAAMAGMKGDLEAMPLGLHTIVAEGGDTLSGGQRQRLLIARALVSRPRILLFDEATSALDNRAQEVVSESIDRLHATRIVIAHRLSTIRSADRIYVLDHGRIVQSGTFDALMSEPGLFADLAARQEVHG
jgi:NHLM bacteriocin system ABC transporter ATP-binding protein